MIQESITLEGIDPEELISEFKAKFFPDFSFTNSNGSTRVFIIEEYYLRAGNFLSANIIIDFLNEKKFIITIIASGGGAGLLELIWNSEKSMLKKLRKFFLNK